MRERVAIVGGGISGLSTAYYLAKAGIRSVLYEREPRLGGVILTERVKGCVLEAGPDSFLAAKPQALELIRELGLGGDVITSNDHLRVTYVVKDGRLVPLPDGLMLMVPTRVWPMLSSGLLGAFTKLRMGLEWLRRPAGSPRPDRSVADFIREHYGQEAVDYLAEPLLAGVYGGDPQKLSAASVLTRFVELETAYGSLTRGVLAERKKARRSGRSQPLFQTLKGGLGQLIEALTAAVEGHCEVRQSEVERVEPSATGFRLRVRDGCLDVENVVLACPAYEAGRLVGTLHPDLARLLGDVPYSSSMTISLIYDRATLGHPLNGFGFLVPQQERRKLVACTWVGTKFSHRVPDDLAVLRCFVGGMDHRVIEESDEPLVEAIRGELRQLMGVGAAPLSVHIARWPRSMAQYTVGHGARREAIDAAVKTLPGLHLAGNAYTGIGISDCTRMGRAAAERIASGG